MVTQGQLKNIAVAAFDELQANLPGGAGGRVTALVEQWLASDGAGNLLYDWQGNHIAAATPNNDFVAVNLGQVKAVAAPFYDRLIQTGYCSSYPWNGPTSDFASVNLGQLKSVFSFDVGADSDQNGLPDWWEMKYFGHILGTNPANIPYGATLISLRYEFTNGIDPTTGFADVYGGNLPSLTMSVGNGQVSSVNRFFKQALAVQVRDASGHPLPNAPVTFSVQQGGGSLADPFTLGQMGGAFSQLTDRNGLASVRAYAGSIWGPLVINATAQTLVGTTPRTASASFNLAVSGLPQKPPAFTVAAPGDGSATFSWTTPVGSVDHFTISYSADNGVTWQPIATAAGGASSVTIASGALPSGAGPGSGAFAIQTTNSAGTSSQQLDPDYGALDNDMDGLTNRQEADEGTDPNNPDTDGDGVPDGQDAWPNEKLLSFSRIGTPAYAVIDLGPASSGMFPWALNNKGDIVYGQRVDQTNNRYFFVPAGQTIASAIEMKPSDSNPAPTGWTRDPYGYFVPSLSDNGEAAGRWIMKNSADSTDPTSPKYEVTWDPVSHDLDYRGMASADDQVTTNLGPGWLKAFNDRQCPSAVAVNASGQILDTMGSAGGIYVAGPGGEALDLGGLFDVGIPGRSGSALQAGESGVFKSLGKFFPQDWTLPKGIFYYYPALLAVAENDAGDVIGSGQGDHPQDDIYAFSDSSLYVSVGGGAFKRLSYVGADSGVIAMNNSRYLLSANTLFVPDVFRDPSGATQKPVALPGEGVNWIALNNSTQAIGSRISPLDSTTTEWFVLVNDQAVSLESLLPSGWLINAATSPATARATTMNSDGVILAELNQDDGTNHLVNPLPVEVIVRKKGEAVDPKGVLVKKGDVLEIALAESWFAQEKQFENLITWQYRQMKLDGTFEGWTDFGNQGKGTKFKHTTALSGIFELKAVIGSAGSTQDQFYQRKKDDPHSAHKKGENDCFGVADDQWQINVRQQAWINLGSTAYARAVKNGPVPAGPPGGWKCNLFVAHKETDGGATVPWINSGWVHSFPPSANQWAGTAGTEQKNIPNWSLLGADAKPQAGYVVARGASIGHTGILDYDGAWISAGELNVNRKADLREPYYQPARVRKYTGN